MDILRFINSKDVRAHLEKTGYEFSPLEAAWLIYHSRRVSLAEKRAAWRELIATTPDCEIPARPGTVPQASLHRFLESYIALQDKCEAAFRVSDGGWIYTVAFAEGHCASERYRPHTCYSSFDAAVEDIRDYVSDYTDIAFVCCEKMLPNEWNSGHFAFFTPQAEIFEVDRGAVPMTDAERDIWSRVFPGMWFDFPTPFAEGDILLVPDYYRGGPFVNRGVGLAGLEESVKENIRRNGDETDMCARGFFCGEKGVFAECTDTPYANLTDIEYYREPLTGAERLLKPISAFMKGEIDVALCCRAYHAVAAEETAKAGVFEDYSEDEVRAVGLTE